MDIANKEVVNEVQKNRLADLVQVYMSQDEEQANYWAGLLKSVPGFSVFYYRTHLMLGEHSLYRRRQREQQKETTMPYPMDWYLTEGRDTGRLEDVLDQQVHLSTGQVTAVVLGIDTVFQRILTEDGKVYQLRVRVNPPKKVLTAALFVRK